MAWPCCSQLIVMIPGKSCSQTSRSSHHEVVASPAGTASSSSTPHVAALALQALKAPLACTLASGYARLL